MMASYRDHGFDPNAYEVMGPPLRPYNWVQWVGVVFAALGVLAFVAYCAEKIGLIPMWMSNPAPVIMLGALGSVLVNTRRQPIPEAEQAEYRRKLRQRTILAFVVAAIAAAVGLTIAVLAR